MKRVFFLNEKSKIYVICPANNKTGGTELLHQLVYHLNENRKKAYITYYLEGESDKNNPTPIEFRKYVSKFCLIKDVEDLENNVLVIPEICIGKHRKFKKIQKCIWWLSVDNYSLTCGKIKRLKKYGFKSFFKHLLLNDYSHQSDLRKIGIHLYQSYFAADFLAGEGIKRENTYYLSDYINDIYIDDFNPTLKEDIVIYNPQKGYEFTQKLIISAPDIRWIPIQNMTNVQVHDLLHRAKIYIDFGGHPGKDRIPREAAMSGCCVITNKKGAAAYSEDVPISNHYKIEDVDSNISFIIETIKYCMENYNEVISEYSIYRNFIKNEKNKFQNDIKKIFE